MGRPDLSIAIQHVPDLADRREWVQAIVDQIRSESPDIQVKVLEDATRQGPWASYRRALESCDARHHIVLQDDVQLCCDFIASALATIAARPREIICAYNHSSASLRAKKQRVAWIRTQLVWGPATIWPRELIGPFLAWERRHVDPSLRDDDIRVSMWLHTQKRHAFATTPSIVQHLGVESSSVSGNIQRPESKWFIGAHRSGADVDWSRGLDHPVEGDDEMNQEFWDYLLAGSPLEPS